MKKLEQLDCQLECKATASLNAEIASDLEQEDRSLEDLINEKDSEDNEQTSS